MSRQDYSPAMAAMLDRFESPPPRADLAGTILRAKDSHALPPRVLSRPVRRGLWQRGRFLAIGAIAFGMLGAAAVAAGLLSVAGVEVPVLTAMLAPRPVVKAAPVQAAVRHPVQQAVAMPPPPAAPRVAPPPGVAETIEAPSPVKAQREFAFVARLARMADRRVLLSRYPGWRDAVLAGPEARRLFLIDHPELHQALREQRAARMQQRRSARAAPTSDAPAQQAGNDADAAMEQQKRETLIALRRLRTLQAEAR